MANIATHLQGSMEGTHEPSDAQQKPGDADALLVVTSHMARQPPTLE